MKVGLLLGSFNPLHNGHIMMGLSSLSYVDEVWFVLAKQNPYKTYSIANEHRCKMLSFVDRLHPQFHANYIEFQENLSGFTCDTLTALSQKYPYEFYIICGTDIYRDIPNWQNGEDILKTYRFIVFDRYKDHVNMDNVIISSFEHLQISSSFVRNIINTPYGYAKLYCYVPNIIANYIITNTLYVKPTSS